MNFVVGLPCTKAKYDSTWIIIDRLTKFTHFLPMKTTDTAKQYAMLYLKEIVRLHMISTFIISDQGMQFTAHFWKIFQYGLGTRLNLSTASHL